MRMGKKSLGRVLTLVELLKLFLNFKGDNYFLIELLESEKMYLKDNLVTID